MPESGEASFIYMVGRVNQGIRREMRARLSQCELSVAEYTTLSVLAARPELSNAQLSRRALVTPQSMIEILGQLEERGLVRRKVRRDSMGWQWRTLRNFPKPTIAMVNGWCFGGAFTPLVACDLAIAADEAQFGLSEINWGIPPGSVVNKALAETVGSRAALLYIMTGRTFDGRQAAEMGLVNSSVPLEQLRDEVE